MILPKEPEGRSVSKHDLTVFSEALQEINSDEGWREANPKVRSGNGTSKKFGRRHPNLALLNTNSFEYFDFRDSNSRREAIFLGQKTMPKTSSTESSALKHSKALSSSAREDSRKFQAKTPGSRVSLTYVSKISTTPATLIPLASKSVSYKKVALAPPGTVTKPLLEKVEEINVEFDAHISNSPPQTSKEGESNTISGEAAIPDNEVTKDVNESGIEFENSASELEGIPCSSYQEKSVATNGSKLSAEAQPFSPGAFPLTQPLNSVAVTSVYDVIDSQGLRAELVGFPPVAASVPCWPRSPLYYRATHSFRMQHGFLKYQKPIMESGVGPKIMNPNAPEFVPGRAWQTNPASENSKVSTDPNYLVDTGMEFSAEVKFNEKATIVVKDRRSKKSSSDAQEMELARQKLLSFIVK